jgi:hypothetical protein
MSAPVRLAGHGCLGDDRVTWTISEGARGRRWREVLTRGGMVVHSLLLETGPDRRFTHLELSVAGALLTLHPEGNGTLHGNRVDAWGTDVEHVDGLPFPEGSVVLVEGSPIGSAAASWSGRPVGAVVDRGGRVRLGDAPLDAPLDAPGIDERGVPVLDGGEVWPLER